MPEGFDAKTGLQSSKIFKRWSLKASLPRWGFPSFVSCVRGTWEHWTLKAFPYSPCEIWTCVFFCSWRASLWTCPSVCSSTSTWRECLELRKDAIPQTLIHAINICHVLCLCLDRPLRRAGGHFLLFLTVQRPTLEFEVECFFVFVEKLARSLRWWCPWSGLRR